MARQPRRPRWTTLPVLMEELVEEILLRIPPDRLAHLYCAAWVCKTWRRIILSDDPGCFLRRYRAFHRLHPPLLGFLYNERYKLYDLRPSFMPVAAAFPSMAVQYLRRLRARCVLDCRHGRVLLEDLRGRGNLIVWDPISNASQELPALHMGYCRSYCAAVLCAAAGCDHHDCRGGGNPFFAVYLGTDGKDDDTIIKTCVYSSESRSWGMPVSSQLDTRCYFNKHRAAVIGDEIYFVVMLRPGARILKYDLVKHCISFFTPPSKWGACAVLMQNDDGSLGFASIMDSKLYLWSRMVNSCERITAQWVQWRVIELDRILPIIDNKPCTQAYVTGFAEGVGILFISTSVGNFTFQLELGRLRKITGPVDFSPIFPFISFFTPCKVPALY